MKYGKLKKMSYGERQRLWAAQRREDRQAAEQVSMGLRDGIAPIRSALGNSLGSFVRESYTYNDTSTANTYTARSRYAPKSPGRVDVTIHEDGYVTYRFRGAFGSDVRWMLSSKNLTDVRFILKALRDQYHNDKPMLHWKHIADEEAPGVSAANVLEQLFKSDSYRGLRGFWHYLSTNIVPIHFEAPCVGDYETLAPFSGAVNFIPCPGHDGWDCNEAVADLVLDLMDEWPPAVVKGEVEETQLSIRTMEDIHKMSRRYALKSILDL